MPFKSESQRRYLFAKEPDVAHKFAEHTTEKQMQRLPEHVEKMSEGGMMCRHCGGMVGEDGYSTVDLDGGDEEGEMKETSADDGTEQMEATVSMRNMAELMRKRRGD